MTATANGPSSSVPAANLSYHLSGSIPGNLHKTAFAIEGSSVRLHLGGNMLDVMGDAVKKRIDGVSETYASYNKK